MKANLLQHFFRCDCHKNPFTYTRSNAQTVIRQQLVTGNTSTHQDAKVHTTSTADIIDTTDVIPAGLSGDQQGALGSSIGDSVD